MEAIAPMAQAVKVTVTKRRFKNNNGNKSGTGRKTGTTRRRTRKK